MTVLVYFDVSLLPVEGGLSGDPSCFSFVNHFLKDESNYEKVVDLLRDESGLDGYLSLIDLLLVELIDMDKLKDACHRFYNEKGKPFCDLYSAGVRSCVQHK